MHHCFRLTNPLHHHHHHPYPPFTHTQTYKFKKLENFCFFSFRESCQMFQSLVFIQQHPPSLLIFLSLSPYFCYFVPLPLSSGLLFIYFYRPSSLISQFPLLLLQHLFFFSPSPYASSLPFCTIVLFVSLASSTFKPHL